MKEREDYKAQKKPYKFSISHTTLIMIITLGVLVLWLCFMLILRTNTKICEWVCDTFVNAYTNVAGRIYSLVDFNVFEVLATLFVIAVIAVLVAAIVLFAKGKKVLSRQLMIGILIGVAWISNLYIFTAGFAYNREKAPIPVYESEIDADLAKDTYITLINDFNDCVNTLGVYPDGRAVCPYTEKELRQKVEDAYKRLVTDEYYYDFTAKGKPVISSGIMASFSISGITFTPTVEGGYNKDMPAYQKVCTIAHELAHTKGVMREDEANALAAFVLLNSGDAYLRYSFYVDSIWESRTFIMYRSDFMDIYKNNPISKAYSSEVEYSSKWWDEHNFMQKIGNFFNDLYLKFNGEDEGSNSYYEPPKVEDSGEKDEEGKPIYIVVNYNTMQKIMVDYYVNNLQSN